MHAATVDAAEYMPAAHAVHSVAPVPLAVFVIEPGGQTMQPFGSSEPAHALYLPAGQSVHDDTFDAVEYFPTSQAVHVAAPLLLPVSVIEPGGQGRQEQSAETGEK